MTTQFKLIINTDNTDNANAAFHADDEEYEQEAGIEATSHEVARILRSAAESVSAGLSRMTLHDINGNTVGHYELTEES